MFVLAIALSYLLGSIPVGYMLGRFLRGIDVRRYGSGNFGAANVFRVISPAAGIVVLVLDMLKGFLPVALFGDFVIGHSPGLDPVLVRLSLAVAAVCGHNWTIFLKFKGGKGVATSAGALVGLGLKITSLGLIAGLCLGVWVLALITTGFVSLSSIIAACALPVFMVIFNQPIKLIVFTAMLCLFVVYRHKSNIGRLLRGQERKIFSSGKY